MSYGGKKYATYVSWKPPSNCQRFVWELRQVLDQQNAQGEFAQAWHLGQHQLLSKESTSRITTYPTWTPSWCRNCTDICFKTIHRIITWKLCSVLVASHTVSKATAFFEDLVAQLGAFINFQCGILTAFLWSDSHYSIWIQMIHVLPFRRFSCPSVSFCFSSSASFCGVVKSLSQPEDVEGHYHMWPGTLCSGCLCWNNMFD